MDYLDDYDADPRPRLFVSRASAASSPSISSAQKPTLLHLLSCYAAAFLLLFFSYSLYSSSQTLASVLLWFASSLLLAPFAPASASGGPFSIGRGPPLPDPVDPTPECENPKTSRRIRNPRARTADIELVKTDADVVVIKGKKLESEKPNGAAADDDDDVAIEEKETEWTEQDMEMLRKQMVRHPAGEPQRWEKISAAFGGRHSKESVIRAAKAGGSVGGDDSFKEFLRKRKPVESKAQEAVSPPPGGEEWSSGDDLALLNALKAFPKESSMRWEKIAAAVPGKTKAACVNRVAELKKGFRSSKAASESSAC